MIGKSERKEVAREFRERRSTAGIYRIHCRATDRSWVDSSPNLGAAQNGQFFQLRQRLHRNKDLQAEWNTHGESAFEFTILETLPEDTPELLVRDLLTERRRAWTARGKE